MRDPLLALGAKDPVARLSEIKARDPERQRVIELFNVWWENHGSDPVKVSELAPEVKEIADPSDRGRQYLARAIGKLAGTRQGGFLLERFGDLPNSRKEGARYQLLTADKPKSSASSAESASSRNSDLNPKACKGENSTDDSADDLRMGQVIHAASARHTTENIHNRINGLPANAADGADNADDSGKPGADRRDATLDSRTCVQCGAGPRLTLPAIRRQSR